MTTITRTQFDAARTELTTFVLGQAIDLVFETGVGWEADANAPTSYEALCAAFEVARNTVDGTLTVSSEFCDTSVYGTPDLNHAFRFWHDVRHIQLALGFGFGDELLLALDHQHQAVLAGVGRIARLVLWADTQGQNEYLQRTGQFPTDQLEFAWRHVTAHLADVPPIAAVIAAGTV